MRPGPIGPGNIDPLQRPPQRLSPFNEARPNWAGKSGIATRKGKEGRPFNEARPNWAGKWSYNGTYA